MYHSRDELMESSLRVPTLIDNPLVNDIAFGRKEYGLGPPWALTGFYVVVGLPNGR